MGWNTTVVVMNDALHDIEQDPEFGRKLARSIMGLAVDGPQEVSAGSHARAAVAIETHHADIHVVLAIGDNSAVTVGSVFAIRNEELMLEKERILHDLADQMGFHIRKKPVRK